MMILGSLSFGAAHETKLEGAELSTLNTKSETVFKYGQYVYVELKDGSSTIGKIVGRKGAKKYYVLEVNGSHRGVVHAKYLKALTKEEINQKVATKKNR